ncbi:MULTISPECIES: biotin/lipoate A/B protein ligase family protein [unclassified Leptolyngbya]|uniref:lipoate--protein ligase family protein n=1 Tax=unclassified Leptolyngbya TaxID=2650499 RepID=UPI001684BBEB|nr:MULTISPECIES: biotin/lipoate A/B protein ligase family protein [unclassified Leptolyngbya]MBD1911834.1 lipoate--protein ligase family protein [Leptolyngbya sp. FACHB-8]MBD2158213.1 lipoate--protein ligase family protein [Leptolyngbya sp. FACHB-16]
MALDTWLLERHAAGAIPPTLRFYAWDPIALSLGYHQRQIPQHWNHLKWEGRSLPLILRPSGGRAVLHQGDLTYAIVGSGFKGGRIEVYQYLCEFLVQGWRSLAVPLHYGEAGRGYIHNPDCFETATGADLIMADGTKLIGSAQLRRNGAVLQHGSMRLCPDPDLFQQVFGTAIQVPDLPLVADLEERRATAITTLTQAAEEWFGVTLREEPLSEDEWVMVQARLKSKS